MTGAPCSARLRNGDPCRSVATENEFCAYHAEPAAEVGPEAVANGSHVKRRNARERVPVVVDSAPLKLSASAPSSPSAVRPALALTAAEEVETIRRVLLEAATSTTRETWATCTCPECGKGFRQEISVPDHGARIKAIETLLREGLGRVGEAEVVEPKMPASADEVKNLSWDGDHLPSRSPVRQASKEVAVVATVLHVVKSVTRDRPKLSRSVRRVVIGGQ